VNGGDSTTLVVGREESRRRSRRGLTIGLVLGAGYLTFAISVGPWVGVVVGIAGLVLGAMAFYGERQSHVVFRAVERGYLEATLVRERRSTRAEHVVRCAPADVEAQHVGFGWQVTLQRRWSVVQTLTRRSAEAHVAAIRALSVLEADDVAPKAERRARFVLGASRGLRRIVGGGVALALCLAVSALLPQVSFPFWLAFAIGMPIGMGTFEWVDVEVVRSHEDGIRVAHRRRWSGTAPSPWVVRDARELGWIRGRLVWWWTVDGEPLGWCLHRAGVVRDRLGGSHES